MKRVLILGSNSTLAKKVKLLFDTKKIDLVEYSKKKINFLNKNSPQQIKQILKKEEPDVILNFAAVLGSNNNDYRNVYDINFLPNWEITKFYIKNPIKKKVKIIFIGSSSFKRGKGNYMLYSSSKAAIHNLYQGAKEKFKNTNIQISIFHPHRFKSKLLKNLKKSNKFHNINDVARDLLKKIL